MSGNNLDLYTDFRPQINHIERAKQGDSVHDEDLCSFSGHMYETYGEELAYVREQPIANIWTIVEDDNGNWVVIPGYKLVNRMGYLICENPWDEKTGWFNEDDLYVQK
jgi:hypothetical protein